MSFGIVALTSHVAAPCSPLDSPSGASKCDWTLPTRNVSVLTCPVRTSSLCSSPNGIDLIEQLKHCRDRSSVAVGREKIHLPAMHRRPWRRAAVSSAPRNEKPRPRGWKPIGRSGRDNSEASPSSMLSTKRGLSSKLEGVAPQKTYFPTFSPPAPVKPYVPSRPVRLLRLGVRFGTQFEGTPM